jgi:DNA-directed RNA polymerase subunit RPC12/RpoP
MEFDSFKEKLKKAGFKVGLLSKNSYMELCKMVSDDENILFSSESYPEKAIGIIGAIIITDKNLYGNIPLMNKTFESIIIATNEIQEWITPMGKEKTFKVKTSQGVFSIGMILNNIDKLIMLINKKERVVVSNSSSQEENSFNPPQKEVQDGVAAFYTSQAISINYEAVEAEKKLRCPKCNSNNIQPLSAISGKTKGFGLGKAVLGAAITMNPLGLTAGVIGMGKGKTKTDVIWVCSNCGNKFDKPKRK